jgi:hypothetical protein
MKWLLFFISTALAQEPPPDCKDTQAIIEMQRNTAFTWHANSEARLLAQRAELEKLKKELDKLQAENDVLRAQAKTQ